jgi:hypothetical protein
MLSRPPRPRRGKAAAASFTNIGFQRGKDFDCEFQWCVELAGGRPAELSQPVFERKLRAWEESLVNWAPRQRRAFDISNRCPDFSSSSRYWWLVLRRGSACALPMETRSLGTDQPMAWDRSPASSTTVDSQSMNTPTPHFSGSSGTYRWKLRP